MWAHVEGAGAIKRKTATGFIASRFRQRVYVVIGVVAGTFSLVIGAIFLLGLESKLPSIEAWLSGGGT